MYEKIIFIGRLFRVEQWVKNLFIFFPLIFAGKLTQENVLAGSVAAFFGFCLISSSTYILNDFLDIKADKLHPKKSLRPLVKVRINKFFIIALILSLMTTGLTISFWVNKSVLYVVCTYVILHLFYNFFTKRMIILDVICIALGFQLRVWAGSYAADVLPSVWLQLCVFLLALFLGFVKRRHELSTLKDKASEHRSVLAHYTSYLLDQIIIICATLTIVFYSLYTISPDVVARLGNHNMVYTIIFVIYGIFRYFYLVHVRKLGGDPGEVIFSDFPILMNLILWVMSIVIILYVAG